MLRKIPHEYGLLYPDDELRELGVHVLGDIKSGKSSLLGRCVAFLDFMRGVPTVMLDNGDSIDNFLHKILKFPKHIREAMWPRIRYVPLGGLNNYVVPMPLYYRLGDEDPLTIAQRFVDTLLTIDPALANAPIMGTGAIQEVAEPMGIELIQRGWQISELPLLTSKIPSSLKTRLIPFMYSNIQRAIYCADTPGIDWQEVIDKRQIVLLDYRGIERPQFALTWVLDYFFTFMLHRGMYQLPYVSLIIDEFALLKKSQRAANDKFFEYWQNILTNVARHHNIWLFLAHQKMGQFDDQMQDLLVSMHTQIIGKTSSMRTARTLSQQLADVDPYKIKRMKDSVRPQLVNGGIGLVNRAAYEGYIGLSLYEIHEEPVEFTAGEQYLEQSKTFKKIPSLDFSVHVGMQEPVSESLIGTETNTDIRDRKNQMILAAIRKELVSQQGRKVEDVLTEIAARTAAQSAPIVLSHQPPLSSPSAPIKPPRPMRPMTKTKPPK